MKTKRAWIKTAAGYDFLASLLIAAPIALLCALSLFFCCYLPSLMTMAQTANTYQMFFFSDESGFFTFLVWQFLLMAGALTALRQFRFTNNKKLSLVQLSFGISRARLYGNRCLSAAASLFFGVLFPLTATLMLNLYRYGLNAFTVKVFLLFVLSAFTAAFVGYTAGLTASVLSNSARNAALLSALLLLFPLLLVFFTETCCMLFLRGYDCWNGLFELSSQLYFLCPPLMLSGSASSSLFFGGFYSLWQEYGSCGRGADIAACVADPAFSKYALFIVWILLCVLTAGALYRLFLRKKFEYSGQPHRSEGAVVLSSSFVVTAASMIFWLVTWLFLSTFYDYLTNRFVRILFSIIVYSLPCVIILLICLRLYAGSRKRLKHYLKLTPLILLPMLIPLSCLSGGFGYVNCVPDIADIQSIGIDGLLLPDDMALYLNDEDILSNYLTGGFESDADKQRITTLHRLLTKGGDNAVGVTIKYHLKDGGELLRTYDRCSEKALAALSVLFDSDAMESYLHNQLGVISSLPTWEEAAVLPTNDEEMNSLHAERLPWLMYGGSTVTLRPVNSFKETEISNQLTEESYYGLLSCYAQELVALSATEFLTPNEPPVGVLSFHTEDYTFYDDRDYVNLYITAEMTKTISYLQSLGLSGALKNETPITQIALYPADNTVFFQQDSTYINLNNPSELGTDGKPSRIITDRTEIEAMSKKLYPYYLIAGQDISYAIVTYEEADPEIYIIKNK